MSEENVARIKRQNARKISVVIGNPPYNANQPNENDNNKNREYPEIDKRIKETYIDESTAQKTKLYDMYARFFRWASDRVDENGIVAFITNRSFIESRTFDGFRKTWRDEFNDIYIVDLGGDVRANPKLSGTKNNVFGIQTGVAISFMVKRARRKATGLPDLLRTSAGDGDGGGKARVAGRCDDARAERIRGRVQPDRNRTGSTLQTTIRYADSDRDQGNEAGQEASSRTSDFQAVFAGRRHSAR